jgi:phosphatidylinositol alpha-1,6-mannosyltransferase
MVYLEAQASGLPVIAGNSGGAPETVDDAVTGFVVDPTPTEVAGKIIDLLDHPAKAKAMGQAARRWIESEWDWSTRATTLAHLLDTMA